MSAEAALAVAHPRAVVLLPATARAAGAAAWEALHDGTTSAQSAAVLLERLLDAVLAASGPRPLQVLADLAVAVRDGDEVRVLVRGGVPARWESGPEEALTSAPGDPWAVHRRRGPGRVVLGRPTSSSPSTSDAPVLASGDGVVLEVPGAVLDPTGPLVAARPDVPVPAPPPVESVPSGSAVAPAIRLPDGSRHGLEGPVVLGRAPLATGGARAVPVASPRQQISATHLGLRADPRAGAVLATDLGSTNGTVLVGPPARSLLPGEPVVVVVGDRLDLGEGVVVEVVAGEAP